MTFFDLNSLIYSSNPKWVPKNNQIKMTKSAETRQNYKSFKMILDKSLSEKVINYAQQNEMKLTGILRRALRDFFESEEMKQKQVN